MVNSNRSEIVKRLKQGAYGYFSNDAVASALVGIIFGKKVDDLDFLNIEACRNEESIKKVLSLLDELMKSNIDNSIKSNILNLIELLKPHIKKSTLLVFCGPSCVGKDCIASEVKRALYLQGHEFGYLDKYTTRSPRGYDNKVNGPEVAEPSSNYEYFGDKDKFFCNEDITLHYHLYRYYYGYSRRHLVSELEIDKNLACIYGKLENIDSFINDIEDKYHRKVFSVLLNADVNVLVTRLGRRVTLSENEANLRRHEIMKQTAYIDMNREKLESKFDLIINNGSAASVKEVVNEIISRLNEKDFYDRKFVIVK